MFTFRTYREQDKSTWDQYVKTARNSTFLFHRDYMDYHADRFDDYSLLISKGSQLYALLPAHRNGATLVSHFGLTYGGLVMDCNVTAADVLTLFAELNTHLKQEGFRKVVYRPVPWIYHRMGAEEDLYAIFWKCNARLQSRNIGTTIFLYEHPQWRKDHRRRLNDAHENGVRVSADDNLQLFWTVLQDNLRKRYNATPVHSLAEILMLKKRFPDNIIQYNAYIGDTIIGGLTVYLSHNVVHGQYSATTDEGKKHGAMEAIYEKLIADFPDKRFLDFGSSTECGGSILNTGLISHKEGYGGRAVCYDTYEWDLE